MYINLTLIMLIPLLAAVLAQPLRNYADRQSHRSYVNRDGEPHTSAAHVLAWLEDQHLAGQRRCIYTTLQVVQGISVIMAIGSVGYWWLL